MFFVCVFPNVDRCAARLHNCTKYGQQCENTQQGTVRCTCRQGFTRVKDECHPTGTNQSKIVKEERKCFM